MDRSGKIVFCAVVAGIALVALSTFPRSAEPAYAGRPLSSWVEEIELGPPTAHQGQSPTNALNHIGPAALPFLVRWIQYEAPTNQPAWQEHLTKLGSMSSWGFAKKFAARISCPKAQRLRGGSIRAFESLGAKATPATPDLCRIMNNPTAPLEVAATATRCLRCIGTNAMPALTDVLQTPNHSCRLTALESMFILARQEGAALPVPAIIGCLTDTNSFYLPGTAARILGECKAAPKISVPALAACLKSRNDDARARAAHALGLYGEQASAAIPALTVALRDPSGAVRNAAADALHEIGPIRAAEIRWHRPAFQRIRVLDSFRLSAMHPG